MPHRVKPIAVRNIRGNITEDQYRPIPNTTPKLPQTSLRCQSCCYAGRSSAGKSCSSLVGFDNLQLATRLGVAARRRAARQLTAAIQGQHWLHCRRLSDQTGVALPRWSRSSCSGGGHCLRPCAFGIRGPIPETRVRILALLGCSICHRRQTDRARGLKAGRLRRSHISRASSRRGSSRSGPANRVGKLFVDYFRKTRGATTAATFSARARPGVGVSMPVEWGDLAKLKSEHSGRLSRRVSTCPSGPPTHGLRTESQSKH